MVRKMKAIYHTMNLFNMDVSKKCLIGECWVPVADLRIVQTCLTEGSVGFSYIDLGKLILKDQKYTKIFYILKSIFQTVLDVPHIVLEFVIFIYLYHNISTVHSMGCIDKNSL